MLYAGGRDAVRGPTFELGDNLRGAQRPSAGGAVRASSRPTFRGVLPIPPELPVPALSGPADGIDDLGGPRAQRFLLVATVHKTGANLECVPGAVRAGQCVRVTARDPVGGPEQRAEHRVLT